MCVNVGAQIDLIDCSIDGGGRSITVAHPIHPNTSTSDRFCHRWTHLLLVAWHCK